MISKLQFANEAISLFLFDFEQIEVSVIFLKVKLKVADLNQNNSLQCVADQRAPRRVLDNCSDFDSMQMLNFGVTNYLHFKMLRTSSGETSFYFNLTIITLT